MLWLKGLEGMGGIWLFRDPSTPLPAVASLRMTAVGLKQVPLAGDDEHEKTTAIATAKTNATALVAVEHLDDVFAEGLLALFAGVEHVAAGVFVDLDAGGVAHGGHLVDGED